MLRSSIIHLPENQKPVTLKGVWEIVSFNGVLEPVHGEFKESVGTEAKVSLKDHQDLGARCVYEYAEPASGEPDVEQLGFQKYLIVNYRQYEKLFGAGIWHIKTFWLFRGESVNFYFLGVMVLGHNHPTS